MNIILTMISLFLLFQSLEKPMESDDEDYGDTDIGCSTITIPSNSEAPCKEPSTSQQEKSPSDSDQKKSD